MTRSNESSRRRVLSSIAAAGALSLAGCTTTLPPLGQRVRFGRVDFPASDPPAYRSWVPAPSARPDGGSSVLHTGRPGSLPPSSFGRVHLATLPDWLGTPLESMERAIDVRPAYVFEGSIDPGTVADALDGTGYARAGRYEGYELYSRDDVPRTVAVRDGAAVWAAGDRGGAWIEAVVDTKAGRLDRRHDVDDAFDAITTAVGANHFDVFDGLTVVSGPTADALSTSFSHAYDDDVLYAQSQYLFGTSEDVPERGLRRELRASELAVDADAVDIRTEGRRAIVELRLDSPAEGGDWRTPLITWGAAYDADDGTVTLRHEAGEPVDADQLRVYTGQTGGSPGFPGDPAERQFRDEHGTVAPDDALEIAVGEDVASVSIRFQPTEDRGSTLFRYELP